VGVEWERAWGTGFCEEYQESYVAISDIRFAAWNLTGTIRFRFMQRVNLRLALDCRASSAYSVASSKDTR
jgi:hypothetical protein